MNILKKDMWAAIVCSLTRGEKTRLQTCCGNGRSIVIAIKRYCNGDNFVADNHHRFERIMKQKIQAIERKVNRVYELSADIEESQEVGES